MSDLRWWSTGSGRIELQISLDDAHTGHPQGQCDNDIADLRTVPYIKAQLDKLNHKLVSEELKEYGAWNEIERANHDDNISRLLWIACGDLTEQEVMNHD